MRGPYHGRRAISAEKTRSHVPIRGRQSRAVHRLWGTRRKAATGDCCAVDGPRRAHIPRWAVAVTGLMTQTSTHDKAPAIGQSILASMVHTQRADSTHRRTGRATKPTSGTRVHGSACAVVPTGAGCGCVSGHVAGPKGVLASHSPHGCSAATGTVYVHASTGVLGRSCGSTIAVVPDRIARKAAAASATKTLPTPIANDQPSRRHVHVPGTALPTACCSRQLESAAIHSRRTGRGHPLQAVGTSRTRSLTGLILRGKRGAWQRVEANRDGHGGSHSLVSTTTAAIRRFRTHQRQ